MEVKLKTQVYDVPVKPVEMTIEEEQKREYEEDGHIKIQAKVKVVDSIDTKDAEESRADGKIKPYGLDADTGAYDVEIKEKVEPSVVQEHIEQAIKKETKRKK
jgi:hypothetical protein